MIIKRLAIRNFRSYYGDKVFNFQKGLNMILGSNGDGKTTFFEALNWVLTMRSSEEDKLPELESLVSAKFFSELKPGERGHVMVMLVMENSTGQDRNLERSFMVEKKADGRMSISNIKYSAFRQVGYKRVEYKTVSDLLEKEGYFPAVVKKYCLFKGESTLNVFDDKTTLQNLIDMYSDIKDLNPFKDFAVHSISTSQMAVDNAQEKKRKKDDKNKRLKEEMAELKSKLEDARVRLEEAKKQYDDTSGQIAAIEGDLQTIEVVHSLNQSISVLNNEIERLDMNLNEDYATMLLDDYWILLGFQPILNEYAEKMAKFSLDKRGMQQEYDRQIMMEEAKEKAKEEARQELVQEMIDLNWNVPDINTMKEMLNAHKCKVCGTEAPEGSDAYNFMKKRLDLALEHLEAKNKAKKQEKKEYPQLFKGRDTEDIHDRSVQLLSYGMNISEINHKIEELMAKNAELKAKIAEKVAQKDEKEDKVAQIVAESRSGADLAQFATNYANIKSWNKTKEDTAVQIENLTRKTIPELKARYEEKRAAYNKTVDSAEGQIMLGANDFFTKLLTALENTEMLSFEEFLARLMSSANKFLNLLNVDDFTGVIQIEQDVRGKVNMKLVDKTGKLISNPNTSLLTTMHISILLAISEITKENKDNEYPLIFDAPTSSFDEGKDKGFYECLNNNVGKQCIVVTKSYLLKDNDTNEFVLDQEGLDRLSCPIYRIKKLEGFDKQDLSTIDTIVEPIKMK